MSLPGKDLGEKKVRPKGEPGLWEPSRGPRPTQWSLAPNQREQGEIHCFPPQHQRSWGRIPLEEPGTSGYGELESHLSQERPLQVLMFSKGAGAKLDELRSETTPQTEATWLQCLTWQLTT